MSAVYTTIYIERNDRGRTMEHKVEVKFDYRRACKGARDTICRPGDGPALEPDEPAELEFIHAKKEPGGEYIELSDQEIAEAEEQAWQARENAAFERLASARECLDAVEGAYAEGGGGHCRARFNSSTSWRRLSLSVLSC